MAEAAAGGEVRRRGGCCGGGGGGGGLFPEESFASWGAYGRALMETGPRLVERATARSAAAVEVNEVRGRSGAEMKRNLTWWDLAWFGVGAVIGAGIFVLTGQEARDAAGPAVVLSYAVSGVSAMLSVLCYTEFAIEIPVAGGSFAYLRVELGDFVAFIAAGNILLEYCIGGAAVARAWTSYFATLLNHRPNDFRIHAASLAADYSRLDPIAVAVIAVVCALSETRDPARDIPAGLVGAMAVTTAAYCALAATLCLMQPYREIDPDAPFSVAFSAAGMGWARYVVAFGALKGMTTVLLVSAVGQARYLTHIARAHMAPPCLARVHPRLGTPVNATVAMLAATAAIALFTDLGVLANLLSISTLFIFMLVAVALLVRRYYATGETARGDRNRLAGCLAVIVASSVATAAYWGLGGDGGGWAAYAVAVPAWLAATLFLQLRVPMARTPEKWGVPLVPWLPSASIFINIFLLGSIDGRSFMRFGVWTAALLAYYFFFGLHASYDTAKALAAEVAAGKVEEGGSKPAVGGAAGN
uniref:Cationic amino acid transporter C-terminal domain-containing protein n=1 Tax=Oryza rufipogon TaxID=4529 RepID=A0A0E0RJY3_ORYRU